MVVSDVDVNIPYAGFRYNDGSLGMCSLLVFFYLANRKLSTDRNGGVGGWIKDKKCVMVRMRE